MIWLNLKTTTMRSPEYSGSEPVQRATWLNLLAYCCEQENGGRIEGCAAWKDRQWQQTLGVTLDEVQQSCALWKWDGDAVCVAFYPSDKQEEVKAKRDAGKRGGSAKTHAKTQASRSNGAKHNPSRTQAEPKQNPSTTQAEPKLEPNGKERKGRGMEDSLRESLWSEPTREQVIEAARKCGLTEQQAGIWHDDMLSRPISPTGRWTDRNGNEIGSWQHALSAWAGRYKENQRKDKHNGSNGTSGASRIASYRGVGDPSAY